jgi:hypothetical protein
MFSFRVICLLLFAIVFGGCSIPKPLQPPPDAYEVWKKPGANELDVKKALMECGYPSPFGGGRYDFSINQFILANLCMEGNGYTEIKDWGRGWRSLFCPASEAHNPQACQGKSDVPKMKVNRRINSKFCKYDFPEADVCQR